MNPELERQLVKDYPTIFQFHGGNPSETCMAWGCEHDDGWHDLIRNLCDYITAISRRRMYVKLKDGLTVTDEHGDSDYIHIDSPIVRFTQVKEKFAGLRIYFDMYHEIPDNVSATLDEDNLEEEKSKIWNRVSDAVEFTEFISHKTCEVCGKKGKVYRNGWWKTLCEDHKGNRIDISLDEMP